MIRVLLTQDQKKVFREDVWIKCDVEWKLRAGETEDVIRLEKYEAVKHGWRHTRPIRCLRKFPETTG